MSGHPLSDFHFFFFFEPILFWNTSPRLSPVVTTNCYICEKNGKLRLPQISPSPRHQGKVKHGVASVLVVPVEVLYTFSGHTKERSKCKEGGRTWSPK
jgi:hypothetical protein